MNDRLKQIVMTLTVIVVAIILVYLIDFKYVVETIRAADKKLLLISTIAMIIGFLLVSMRLRNILGKRASFREIFSGDALGFMTTPFMPLPTPVLRAIGVERTTPLNNSQVSPALAVDYLLGMLMRVMAFVLVILLIPSAIDTVWSVVGSILWVMILFGGLIWVINHLDQTFDALARWLSLLPTVEEKRVRGTLGELQDNLESAGSSQSLLIALFFTILIMFCFTLYHYFVWAAMPLGLSWRQMLGLSLAVLVVVPPTAPLMIGAYQGLLVGTLAVLRILDVNSLTAYAILVQLMQIIFWLIVGIWVLSRTKVNLRDLIRRSEEVESDPE